MNYRKVNNLLGWVTGAIAYVVYLKTMEPTASFWDCGEFLSCAYKIEVGHSPGAPFFMLLQRMFGIISPSPVNAAMFINSLSALTSALSILFLFWTITHFAKKLLAPNNEVPDNNKIYAIMGAGLVGALAYTFSDTFWFSAVEAEVYGTSSFFTAITFWAILKWENVADRKYADRWLVLIAYLIGISVCVHLLNLLTIPALAMVYYYRRYTPTTMGAVMAFLVGCVVLAFVQFGVIQYIPKIASGFDILFTNSFGMPFDSGSLTFLVLLFIGIIALLRYARKSGKYTLHTAVLCVLFIIIGYSSYVVAIIRSRADVPIDMTNPDNANSFLDYVNREQFGQQPLLYGPYYTSQPTGVDTKGSLYSQSKKDGKDYYEVVGKKLEPQYNSSDLYFFPRIYDNNEAGHIAFYKEFLGLGDGEVPTSADNLKYFFGYQMNWMWWRYFMWNYAGRQNDFEGQGGPQGGNWISGIGFIDKMRGLGDINAMGDGYSNNEARNQLYFLPFILGILGLVFQFNRNKHDGTVIAVLFFFTGAAIGIYLNMPPNQPRERDYAFAGCTYTFAIWIGLGVLMVTEWFKKAAKPQMSAILATAICLLLVPTLMANVEWNDHDRSKKTLARAVAYNTLSSCAPNAVLFTYGDNQTYPLWYMQEVEGFRKDVRVINTSLLGIDWYIDQLNYRINDADAVPMTWKKESYIGDRHNYVRYSPDPRLPQDKFYNLTEINNFMTTNDNSKKLPTNGGDMDNFMPSKNFFIHGISKDDIIRNGLATAADSNNISTELKFKFPKDIAYKSDLAILNIVDAVANQGWKRPLYFDAGLRQGDYAGMGDFMKLEGLVYRLMPYKTTDSTKINQQVLGTIDAEKSYNLFMNKYIWGGAERNDVYFDEPNRHEFVTYRMDASFIANVLAAQGKKQEAVNLIDKVVKNITQHSYAYDYTGYFMAAAYYRAGASDKAKNLTMKVLKNAEDDVNWVNTLSDDAKTSMAGDITQQLQIIQSLGGMAMQAGDKATADMISKRMQAIIPKVSSYINLRGPGNGAQQQQGEEQ